MEKTPKDAVEMAKKTNAKTKERTENEKTVNYLTTFPAEPREGFLPCNFSFPSEPREGAPPPPPVSV